MIGGALRGRSGLLVRERIVHRFVAAASHAVTPLIAPAGSGKSIALSQYLDTLQEPHLRFNLRPEHERVSACARGIAEAIARVAPHAIHVVGDAVRNADGDPVGTARWILETLGTYRGVIAIDDAHVLDHRPAASLVVALIENARPQMRWVVASRTQIAFPWKRWIASGFAAAPIREDALRFTVGEAREAARVLETELRDSDVERLCHVTAGWPTALALALRASHQFPDVKVASLTARRRSYQYLMEQVFAALDESERELLLVSSLLPEIDAKVLALAGFSGAIERLVMIADRVTFLQAVEGVADTTEEPRYRCHDLFRNFLQERLEIRGPDVVRVSCRALGDALVETGQYAVALEMYVRGDAHEGVLSLLGEHGFEMLRKGYGDLIDRGLDVLSHNGYAGHPVSLGLLGVRASESGDYASAVSRLTDAMRTSEDPEFRGRLALRVAFAMLNSGSDPIDLLERASGDPAISATTRSELLALLCAAYAGAERFERFPAMLDEIESSSASITSRSSRATVLHCLGIGALLCGDAERVRRVLEPAAELATSSGMYKLACQIYGNLSGNAFSNTEEIDVARRFARKHRELAALCPEGQFRFSGVMDEVLIFTRTGEEEPLRAILAQIEASGDSENKTMANGFCEARAMLAAWEGRFAEAASHQSAAHSLQHFESERPKSAALHALFLALADLREPALAVLDEHRFVDTAQYENTVVSRRHVSARMLRALAYAFCGQRSRAKALLALRAAGDHAMLRALRDGVCAIVARMEGAVPDRFPDSLATLRERGYGGIARLLERVDERLEREPVDTLLNAQDRALLRSLARGDKPKEIALESGSSLHAVRWRIREINKKLGCSGYEAAIAIARERGLI